MGCMKMKKLSTWLIVIGILVILTPIAGARYVSWQQEKLYQDFLESQDVQDSMKDLDSVFTESTSEAAVTSSAATAPAVQKYKPKVIGRIKIPSISVDLMLVEGTTSKDLNWGAGHMTSTPMPGDNGNTAIAGHRNYTFGSYFSRLEEVKIGDIITIDYNKQEYSYEIYDIFTVLPEDSSVLGQPEGEAIVTLITCHPKGGNSERLIVRGKLIP